MKGINMSKINKWIMDNIENAPDEEKELFWATVQNDITKIVNNLNPEDKAWLVLYIYWSVKNEDELRKFDFTTGELMKLSANELEKVAKNWRLG